MKKYLMTLFSLIIIIFAPIAKCEAATDDDQDQETYNVSIQFQKLVKQGKVSTLLLRAVWARNDHDPTYEHNDQALYDFQYSEVGKSITENGEKKTVFDRIYFTEQERNLGMKLSDAFNSINIYNDIVTGKLKWKVGDLLLYRIISENGGFLFVVSSFPPDRSEHWIDGQLWFEGEGKEENAKYSFMHHWHYHAKDHPNLVWAGLMVLRPDTKQLKRIVNELSN